MTDAPGRLITGKEDFAPILAEAQSRANTAIDSYHPQRAQANELSNDVVYYAGEPGAEDDARTDWMAADARANGFRADYEAAVAERRNASDHAAERISVVIDQSDLNDSFRDNASGLGEQLGQWFPPGGNIDDVVTDLDFMTENPQRDNWITISTTPANEDAAFFGHKAEDYGASAAREIDESRNPAVVSFRECQHSFFYGSETVSKFEVRRG